MTEQAFDLYLRTVSGERVDIQSNDITCFNLEDIAHALSMIPRFNGHTVSRYSVAEHSVLVAVILDGLSDHGASADLLMAGLVHDASEAYLCDMPAPLKQLLPDYRALESNFEKRLNAFFGINMDEHRAEVKRADTIALYVEAKVLRPHSRMREATNFEEYSAAAEELLKHSSGRLPTQCRSQEAAKTAFRTVFHYLKKMKAAELAAA